MVSLLTLLVYVVIGLTGRLRRAVGLEAEEVRQATV